MSRKGEVSMTQKQLSIVDRAVEFAADRHRHQLRKKNDLPYIIHPFAVCLILTRLGCDDEILAAALLHDTLEDTETTLDELRAEFGSRVAEIVTGCSEPDKSLSWEERKKETIQSLKTAAPDVKLVIAADKLHNARSIGWELLHHGESVWDRFNRGRDQQEWYYRKMLAALREENSDPILTELTSQLALEIEKIFDPEE